MAAETTHDSRLHSQMSKLYGVDSPEDFKKKMVFVKENQELLWLQQHQPDWEPGTPRVQSPTTLSSQMTPRKKRGPPEANILQKGQDPELDFLFEKLTPEEATHMWSRLTLLFLGQCLWVLCFALALSRAPEHSWLCLPFGLVLIFLSVQNVFLCHDVMHGATFPEHSWQKLLTHPFSDFVSLPWEEFVLEHNCHHMGTQELHNPGAYAWDPEELHYALQRASPSRCLNILKGLLIPVLHFLGLNDTGALFALKWFCRIPEAGPGGRCAESFWKKWFPCRAIHLLFVASLWCGIWLLGTCLVGAGLRFMLTVSFFCRLGYSAAWMLVTNFTHSQAWADWLKKDLDRKGPPFGSRLLELFLVLLLGGPVGGRARWNEMLFHDVHHAFPNAIGTLSQRGRFHGWRRVHSSAVKVLARGLWKPADVENALPGEDSETEAEQVVSSQDPVHISAFFGRDRCARRANSSFTFADRQRD